MRNTIIAAAMAAIFAAASAEAQDSAWISLFNGKDLKDWDFKIAGQQLNTDTRETFKVVDGALTVDYSKYTNFNGNPFGHIGYKVRQFSHYILRVEYQIGDKQVSGGPGWALQNNGLMLHSQSMASMTLNQDFPISLETQLLGAGNTESDNNSTLNLCTPGTAFYTQASGGSVNTNHCYSAANNTRPAPSTTAWTWATVSVMGDSIIRHYNGLGTSGTPTLTYYRPVYWTGNVSNPPAGVPANGTKLDSGYIVLQAESHPYRFRKVEVLDLVGCMDAKSPSYRPYFVKNKASACAPVPVGGSDARRSGYRFLPLDGGLRVEGKGGFSAQLLALDGTVVEEKSGEGSIDFASRPSDVRIVRVRGSSGLYAARVAFP